ncbi:hypothetical protein LWM68_41255 [Niabella sp. W65]|nr:hypothetical protein [Niabella sp. W65]MCH7368601.1 hypothetical protein [Niabella sp. W65]ULT44189.1 hypothetical protein KRR40_12960 [Niabella sp. I65]
MAVRIRIDKLDLNRRLTKFQSDVEQAMNKGVEEAGEQITRDAKILSSDMPVIANSIQMNQKENGIEVSAGNGMDNTEITAFLSSNR